MRVQLRRARQNLSINEQRAHSLAVQKHLFGSSVFDACTIVAGYLSNDGEIDVEPVMQKLLLLDMTLAVPLVTGQKMEFVMFDQNTSFSINKWGIREPNERITVAIDAIDLALVPLVGFTENGARLGRGGGYYDRSFANNDKAMLIGVAHELQRQGDIVENPWDKRLDAVVTNDGWTLCSERAKSQIETDRV